MAGVLVYIDIDGDQPSLSSLEALGEGRRIASELGATLYAFAAADRIDEDAERRDRLASVVSGGGADKVLLMRLAAESGPNLWATRGEAFHKVCEDLRPMLVLLSGDSAGHDIGPRLAARIGAAFVAEPVIECGPRGEIVFSRRVYGATHRRRLAAEDLGHAVVATLTPGYFTPREGDDDAEVAVLEPVKSTTNGVEYLASSEDPGTPLDRARIVVVAGGGVKSFESYELVCSLAETIGAEIAATRTLCDRGIAPADREIGVGARHVSPTLYIACGASGSSSNIGALSGDAEIIAINRDPEAPIFRVATYGLVGDLEELLPTLIAELQGNKKLAATP